MGVVVRIIEIALVDENPVINYLASELKNIDQIIWLYENTNLKYLDNVENFIRTNSHIQFQRIKIPPSDFKKLDSILNKIKKEYKDHKLVLNLSGKSTVTGYFLFDALQGFVDDIFVINHLKNSLTNITKKKSEIIHTNLTVNEYIRLYGMRVMSSIHFDPKIGKRSRLTYFIGNNIDLIVPFLDNVRERLTRS